MIQRGGKTLRWAVIVLATVFLFFSVGSMILNHWLNKGLSNDIVTSLINQFTGSLSTVENVTFNLPRGGTITGLKIRLPLVGGGNETNPSISIGQVRFKISLLSVLYGTAKLKEAVIDGLEIHAERRDGVLWTQGLNDFLARNTKAHPDETVHPPGDTVNAEEFSSETLDSIISKIYLPFRIKIQEIGVKKLTVTFDDYVGGKRLRSSRIGPVNALFGMTAFLRSSFFWIRIEGSGDGKKLGFDFQTYETPKKGAPPKENIDIKKVFGLSSEITFKDYHTLKVNTSTQGLPEDLLLSAELIANNEYSQINLVRFKTGLGKILQGSLNSRVTFMEKSFTNIETDTSGTGSLNLNHLSQYLKPFQIETAGTAELKKLEIKGSFAADSLKELKSAVLPNVNLNFEIKDVNIVHPLSRVTGINVNFDTQLSQKNPGTAGDGINLAHASSLKIASVLLPFKGQKDKKTAAKPAIVLDQIDVTTKAVVKNISDLNRLQIESLAVNAEIPQIQVTAPNGKIIKTSLKSTVDVTASDFLSKFMVIAKLDVDANLQANLRLHCLKECQIIELSTSTEIPRIDRLIAIISPALGHNIASLPDIRRGSLSTTVTVTAKTPPGKIAEISQRAKKAAGSVLVKSNLKDLDVVDLKSKTSAQGVGFDVTVKGEIEKQQIDVTAGIDSIETPHLPKPLLANSFALSIYAQDLSKIVIKKIEATVPSLGVLLLSTASADINDQKQPQNIEVDLTASIKPQNITPGMAAIEASGEAQTEISIRSQDLKQIIVEGKSSLDKFFLKIPPPKESSTETPLVSVENMNGSFPFTQRINLDDFIKKPTPTVANLDTSTNVVDNTTQKNSVEITKAADDTTNPMPLTLEDKIFSYLGKYKDSQALADNRMRAESYLDVRPSTLKTVPISIDRVSIKELSMTDFEIDADLGQNMFSLNQIVFGLLGGKVQGSLQLTFDTVLRKIRITGQATELDTRKLADSFPKLRDKINSISLLGSSPYIDGTIRLIYDAPSGDIGGGLEVTRIGKDQMNAILLFVDPEEANPTISTMRKALSIGEVRQVSVPIKNGQIGLDLDVRLLMAPIPTPKLQRFPLAQLVRNFTASAANKTTEKEEKTPQQQEKEPSSDAEQKLQ
jgi:hypothetical protein